MHPHSHASSAADDYYSAAHIGISKASVQAFTVSKGGKGKLAPPPPPPAVALPKHPLATAGMAETIAELMVVGSSGLRSINLDLDYEWQGEEGEEEDWQSNDSWTIVEPAAAGGGG